MKRENRWLKIGDITKSAYDVMPEKDAIKALRILFKRYNNKHADMNISLHVHFDYLLLDCVAPKIRNEWEKLRDKAGGFNY